VDEAHVARGGRGDHARRGSGQWFDAGTFRRGLDQFTQQREFAIGVDEIADGIGRTGRGSHL
jgi:hypothetical protein